MIGTWEIIFTLFVVLLLFGGKRLPELARSLGQGIREFKKASSEISDEIDLTPPKPPVK
jgi:sec-independent protein translocase protein TatA